MSLLLLAATGCAEASFTEAPTEDAALAAPLRGPAVHQARGAERPATTGPAAVVSSNGIEYHDGPVMTETPNVYYIWYGGWTGNNATAILTDLASNLGSSRYFAINNSYSNTDGQWVTGSLHYAGSTSDSYSRGTRLTDAGVFGIVSDAISSGRLPLDANGIYLVLSSADVTEAGSSGAFCTEFCGWHFFGAVGTTTVKYAWIGDAHTQCPDACMVQKTGPNGNAGADGMASVIAHEIAETVTDPELSSWYADDTGEENADQCAWRFGSEYSSGGARANLHLGGRDYLIQQNWVNADGGHCDMARFRPLQPDDPIVFNADYYLDEYPDLRKILGNDVNAAHDHWLNVGIAEGRHASRQFDSQWYVDLYSDLKAAFGDDHVAALEHFLQQGLPYEGRRGSRAFDAIYYRNTYTDLNKYIGPDYVGQARHFLSQGLPVEGRAGSLEVDASFYVNFYDDLQKTYGNDHLAAIDHFLRYTGLRLEGRRASAAFDVSYYLSTNPDLMAAFGSTNYTAAFDHWVRSGRNQGRRGAP